LGNDEIECCCRVDSIAKMCDGRECPGMREGCKPVKLHVCDSCSIEKECKSFYKDNGFCFTEIDEINEINEIVLRKNHD
jgi:hypothetical protein